MRTFVRCVVFIICAIETIIFVTCDDDDHQQFYTEMLKLHNEARDKHGAQPLLLNNNISGLLMDYLKGLSDGKLNRRRMAWFYHPYVAENTEKVTAETIFNSFYNEGKDYDYTQEPKDDKAENFTQILWKSSEQVCFLFMYQNNTNYFAAVYSPLGNIKGEYVKNVGIPKKRLTIRSLIPFIG